MEGYSVFQMVEIFNENVDKDCFIRLLLNIGIEGHRHSKKYCSMLCSLIPVIVWWQQNGIPS